MLWIYTAIVRPVLSYTAFIWWPRCKELPIISIPGAMKSPPTAAFEALLNIEPLQIHIESVATCFRLNNSLLLIDANFGHAKQSE